MKQLMKNFKNIQGTIKDEHKQKLLNFKQLNFGKNNHFSKNSGRKLTDPTCFNYKSNHNFQKINITNKRNKHNSFSILSFKYFFSPRQLLKNGRVPS